MKKFILLIFAAAAAGTSMAQDSIWLVPALPQRGAQVEIYFKSDKPVFAHAKTLSGGFFSLDGNNQIVAQDLTFGRSGDSWMATATVPDTAYAVVANLSRPDTNIDNKVVQAYKVEGIPTKFVIDKNGVTRFKAVGFDGNTDNTVDEMESMIALTKKN